MSDTLFQKPPFGWSPTKFAAHQAIYRASRRYCLVNPETVDVPDAMSLSEHMLGFYNQGQAGTCWAHCGKEVAEITIRSLGYKAFSICRMLIGYVGEQILGGGNAFDGGTVSAALGSMIASGGGIGMAHEELDPYKDDRNSLGRKPPQNVYDDAAHYHLTQMVEVNYDANSNDPFSEVKKLIAAGHVSGGKTGGLPVGIGIWWPENWGPPQGSANPIFGPGGSGQYGHAIPIVGYAKAGVIHTEEVFQILNSWDAVYPPLDPSLAKKFVGWKDWSSGGKSPFFYVTRSGLLWAMGKGDAELSATTDATGIDSDVIVPAWDYTNYL